MSSIVRDKSPAFPSTAVLGAHAAMGRTRGKSLSPSNLEAHAGTDRLKQLLELVHSLHEVRNAAILKRVSILHQC